jgi:hypothetical protein
VAASWLGEGADARACAWEETMGDGGARARWPALVQEGSTDGLTWPSGHRGEAGVLHAPDAEGERGTFFASTTWSGSVGYG